jgi:hypothetical protein
MKKSTWSVGPRVALATQLSALLNTLCTAKKVNGKNVCVYKICILLGGSWWLKASVGALGRGLSVCFQLTKIYKVHYAPWSSIIICAHAMREMCAPHYFGRWVVRVVRCERLAKRRHAPRWTEKSGRLPIHSGFYHFVCTINTHCLLLFFWSLLYIFYFELKTPLSHPLFKLNGL